MSSVSILTISAVGDVRHLIVLQHLLGQQTISYSRSTIYNKSVAHNYTLSTKNTARIHAGYARLKQGGKYDGIYDRKQTGGNRLSLKYCLFVIIISKLLSENVPHPLEPSPCATHLTTLVVVLLDFFQSKAEVFGYLP